MMERLRSLPAWLRMFLAFLPVLACLPLTCILLFGYQQIAVWQSGTITAAAEQTRQSAAATGQAVNLAATGSAVAVEETKAAAAVTQTANAAASSIAQAALQQAQTQTQAALLLVPTQEASATGELPSETPTTAPIAVTARPKTVTVTIRECRNFEGTVLFGNAEPQSLHAQGTIAFTVPPGTYRLRILWLNHRDQDTDMTLELTKSQTIQFGDQCQ